MKFWRDTEAVVESCLLPPGAGINCVPGTERRMEACLTVLRRIPPEDFDILENKISTFEWFVPSRFFRAGVKPFAVNSEPRGEIKVPHARVLFLSPLLEEEKPDIVVAIVVHELAHICLDHDLMVPQEKYLGNEEAAWQKIREWGFEREEEKHRRQSEEEGGLKPGLRGIGCSRSGWKHEGKMTKKKEQKGIPEDMVGRFEGNNRQACLFCEATGMETLKDYSPTDIPKGFYCKAYRCYSCGRAWREIYKMEEIQP